MYGKSWFIFFTNIAWLEVIMKFICGYTVCQSELTMSKQIKYFRRLEHSEEGTGQFLKWQFLLLFIYFFYILIKNDILVIVWKPFFLVFLFYFYVKVQTQQKKK